MTSHAEWNARVIASRAWHEKHRAENEKRKAEDEERELDRLVDELIRRMAP